MLFFSITLTLHFIHPQKDLFRVKTEIDALRVLRHKNIAKLLQVIQSEKYIYLVLEVFIRGLICFLVYLLFYLQYCSGGELFDYLVRHRRLPEDETKKIVRCLVRVLGYIHSKGFAHRDIKVI